MKQPSALNLISRRDFTKWAAAASALLLTPEVLAASALEATMFILPGEMEALHKRYTKYKIPVPGDATGDSLRWRLLNDSLAGAKALDNLLRKTKVVHVNGSWLDAVTAATAIEWISTYPPFNEQAKIKMADVLLRGCQDLVNDTALVVPDSVSYGNGALGKMAAAIFTYTTAARLAPGHEGLAELHDFMAASFANVMAQTELVTPDGSSAEGMDYMRTCYVPLLLLAEMKRTLTGEDPAEKFTLLRSMGETYLYKLLPDGTLAREGDNEYPFLTSKDTMVLGYAMHRFRDRHAAWMLRHGTTVSTTWAFPALEFIWADPELDAENPRNIPGGSHAKHFRGVDQVVFRTGFGEKDTRIEFDCGPYFATHQHMDRGHFTIHHQGHLAIDSGADYNGSESPHFLNYYRRTVAHNTMLVYDPAEQFKWGDSDVRAANDGGQRMDSKRYWNTIRSVADWKASHDVWDIGHLRAVDTGDPRYMYSLGDATRAYSAKKLAKFTRELVFLPQQDVLLVFDDVRSTQPEFRKTWLLHMVDEPRFLRSGRDAAGGGERAGDAWGGVAASEGDVVRVQHHNGEMTVHALLPAHRTLMKRGGAGHEFWTPGNSSGGDWGSGRNWPLFPFSGGPLPEDPEERALWQSFYGAEFKEIKSSNKDSVIPGSWRIEVSPSQAAKNDFFLNVFEIGGKGQTGALVVLPIHGSRVEGALCGTTAVVFFGPGPGEAAGAVEFTLAGAVAERLWMRGLAAGKQHRIDVAGSQVMTATANTSGVAMVEGRFGAGSRVRVSVV
ncbi:MAG: heparinase II/III family protein [Acidobacteriota bacterium]